MRLICLFPSDHGSAKAQFTLGIVDVKKSDCHQDFTGIPVVSNKIKQGRFERKLCFELDKSDLTSFDLLEPLKWHWQIHLGLWGIWAFGLNQPRIIFLSICHILLALHSFRLSCPFSLGGFCKVVVTNCLLNQSALSLSYRSPPLFFSDTPASSVFSSFTSTTPSRPLHFAMALSFRSYAITI